jgi:hypothetical protein
MVVSSIQQFDKANIPSFFTNNTNYMKLTPLNISTSILVGKIPI